MSNTEFNFVEALTAINTAADAVLADRVNPNNVTAAEATKHLEALNNAKKKYNDAVTLRAYQLLLNTENPVKALVETLTYTDLRTVKFTDTAYDIETVKAPFTLSGLDKAAKELGIESPLNVAWRTTLADTVKVFKIAAAADVEDKAGALKHMKLEKADVPTKTQLTDALQKAVDVVLFKAKDNGDGNAYTVYKAHRALVEKLVLKQNKQTITGMNTDDMMYLVELMLHVYIHNDTVTNDEDKIKITIEWVEGAISDMKKK